MSPNLSKDDTPSNDQPIRHEFIVTKLSALDISVGGELEFVAGAEGRVIVEVETGENIAGVEVTQRGNAIRIRQEKEALSITSVSARNLLSGLPRRLFGKRQHNYAYVEINGVRVSGDNIDSVIAGKRSPKVRVTAPQEEGMLKGDFWGGAQAFGPLTFTDADIDARNSRTTVEIGVSGGSLKATASMGASLTVTGKVASATAKAHNSGSFINISRLNGPLAAEATMGARVEVKNGIVTEAEAEARNSGSTIEIQHLDGPLDAEATMGARIKVKGGTVTEVEAEARNSGSSIEVQHLDGKLDAEATMGAKIEVKGGTVTEVEAEARNSGSSIEVQHLDGKLEAEATMGARVIVKSASLTHVDAEARNSGSRVQVEHLLGLTGSVSKEESMGGRVLIG